MDLKKLLENIRTLLKKSELGKALELLHEILGASNFETGFLEEVTILLSQFNELQSRERKGTINNENYNLQRNQILDSTLKLLKKIENELKLTENKLKSTKNISSTAQKNRKWYPSGTLLFSQRVGKACPGLRGGKWITKPSEIVRVLETVFKKPLKFIDEDDNFAGEFFHVPFWWFSKGSSVSISNFKVLRRPGLLGIRKPKVLIQVDELIVNRLFVFHDTGTYYKDIIYLETRPDKPTKVYRRRRYLQPMEREEYAIFRGRKISTEEYTDGAVIINGKTHAIDKAEIRVRHLKPFNMIICANDSPYNCTEFDLMSENEFEKILANKISFEEVFENMLKYPRRDKKYS